RVCPIKGNSPQRLKDNIMREIVLDTETTGLDPYSGHRLVEIGCVELKNHVPTGEFYHVYINPERDVPEGAFNVHGLSEEFLRDHPLFKDVVDDFLNFIGDDPLVIHNAKFDMKFLNAELEWLERDPIPYSQAIDTLAMARKKFPGSPATLDALCKRFDVDNSSRHKHGALIDSELLAAVYLELIGGKQPGLSLDVEFNTGDSDAHTTIQRTFRPARTFDPSAEEVANHQEMLKKLANTLWD